MSTESYADEYQTPELCKIIPPQHKICSTANYHDTGSAPPGPAPSIPVPEPPHPSHCLLTKTPLNLTWPKKARQFLMVSMVRVSG